MNIANRERTHLLECRGTKLRVETSVGQGHRGERHGGGKGGK